MWSELVEKAKQKLFFRRYAYRKTFQGEYARAVLEDLMLFCRACESTIHENQKLNDVLQGRREVWLRVQHHLQLSEDQLWTIYTKAVTESEH